MNERRECLISTELCVDSEDSGSVRTACFGCGLPACTGCTVVVSRWYGYGRQRVCLSCLEEHEHPSWRRIARARGLAVGER